MELTPSLVILDFQMPVMNGLQAAERISRISPALPMLLFTMHRSEQLKAAAKAVGIERVVSKSAFDDLISSVVDLLQESPMVVCLIKCEEKSQLVYLYKGTAMTLSEAVAERRNKVGTSTTEQYQRLELATSDARVKSEHAWFALKQHIADHVC